MNKKYRNFSKNEKNIAKLIFTLSTILGILQLLISQIKHLGLGHYEIIAQIILIPIYLISLWFGKEKVISWTINSLPIFERTEIPSGSWSIIINFDENNEIEERTGNMQISHSVYGAKITGGPLIDKKRKKTSMNSWYSEFAELVKFDNHSVIFYIYRIPEGKSQKEKIGFVYGTKKQDEHLFEGFFHDMKLIETEKNLRSGTVIINIEN
jgi:hypothetical protein